MELKINKILEEIIPELEPEKFEALKASIKEKGLYKPIDIMKDGTIIDGHHRYKACKELKITPATSVMENIKTIEEALDYSFEINFRRRQLNPFRQAEWAIKVEKARENLKAKERQLTGRAHTTLGSWDPKVGKVAEILGKKVGLGEMTMTRAIKIEEDAPDKIKERLRNAELGIKDVYEFMTTLDKFPEDKKADFESEFKEGKVDTTSIKNVYEHSLEAEETLNDYNELVQSQVKPSFEKELYTPQFDDNRLKQLQHDLLVASGGNAKLATRFIEVPAFSDEEEAKAKALAKKLGGRYIEKVTKFFYEIEIDPLKEE